MYYQQRGQLEQAADMWGRAEQPEAAVRLYLQVHGDVRGCGRAPGTVGCAA